MEYEPKFDTFAFEEQRDYSLHSSILASLSSLPSPSHEGPPSVPSSPSLELKPLPNILKYKFLGPNETLSVIIADNLNSDQETQVLDLLRENQEALEWILGHIKGISPIIVQY